LSWLLLLEEYGVTIKYLPGKKDVVAVADALSRLDVDNLNIKEKLRQSILSWYYEYLIHPGKTRTEKNYQETMKLPGLIQDVEN
jgi:hypothetical protein